jgi:hypothetical protein
MPATIPESTKTSLQQRLTARAQERWPALTDVRVRFRGRFAYVDGELDSGEVLALCRLRCAGFAMPASLCRLRDRVGVCYLPGQQGRLRRLNPAQRPAQRNPPGGPGLRLRALPRRPQRLVPAATLTTHELTNQTTKARPASAPPGLLRPAAARWDAQPCSCGQRRGDCNHDGSAAGPPASARRPLRTARKLLSRPADQAAPRRIAVLGRFRVERRASGSRSSVMPSACMAV